MRPNHGATAAGARNRIARCTIAGGRRTRQPLGHASALASRLASALAVGLAVAVIGCQAARDTALPDGVVVSEAGLAAPPALSTLTAGVVPTPVVLDVVRFTVAGAPGATGSITRTVATFGSPSGALGAYNGWFARYGFPAVAVRAQLGLGDVSERYDLAWPPLHAVLVRQGEVFVLVEGDDTIAAEVRAPAMATLAAEGLVGVRATPRSR